jgi:hypothetical protein
VTIDQDGEKRIGGGGERGGWALAGMQSRVKSEAEALLRADAIACSRAPATTRRPVHGEGETKLWRPREPGASRGEAAGGGKWSAPGRLAIGRAVSSRSEEWRGWLSFYGDLGCMDSRPPRRRHVLPLYPFWDWEGRCLGLGLTEQLRAPVHQSVGFAVASQCVLVSRIAPSAMGWYGIGMQKNRVVQCLFADPIGHACLLRSSRCTG